LDKAESYFKQALGLSTQINSRTELADANYNLGLLYKKKGRKNLTRQYWRQAQEIYRLTDLDQYQQIRAQLLELNNN